MLLLVRVCRLMNLQKGACSSHVDGGLGPLPAVFDQVLASESVVEAGLSKTVIPFLSVPRFFIPYRCIVSAAADKFPLVRLLSWAILRDGCVVPPSPQQGGPAKQM